MDIPPPVPNNEIEMVDTGKGPWFPMNMEPAQQRKVRNLVLAAKNGDTEQVKEILKTGEVQINSKYKWETPLMVAARSNNMNLCQLLLNHGADCNVSRVMQQTPLWIAASYGNLEVMKLMLDTKGCSQANMNNSLRLCAIMNFLHGCEAMLISGADINAPDSTGCTPLHYAAGSHKEECHESKYWKICNPDSWMHYHGTPFETAELLAMWNANVHTLDSTQSTPLHYACKTGNQDIVKLLIENEADVNAISGNEQKTPLHIAVNNNSAYLVEILLKHPEIKANIVDAEKDTALLTAIQLHNKYLLLQECVRLFLAHEKWAEYMSVAKDVDGSKEIETPMRQLIRLMPDIAALVMDKCIELSCYKDPKHPEFMARFNFAFLDDTYTSKYWMVHRGWNDINNCIEGYENCSETTPVSTLNNKKNDRTDGLFNIGKRITETDGPTTHFSDAEAWNLSDKEHTNKVTPDCDERSFICNNTVMKCKLTSHAKPYTEKRQVVRDNHPLTIACHEKCNLVLGHPLAIALINHKWQSIGSYYFYGGLFIYVAYVAMLTFYVKMTNTHHFTNETINTTDAEVRNGTSDVSVGVVSIILLVISFISIVKDLVSIVVEFPSYLFTFGHWLKMLVYICTCILVLDDGFLSHELKDYPLAAICVFTAWFNILLTMRQLPVIGIFFIMFTRILKNSFIVIFIFFPIIIGFAVTFSILLDFMPLFKGEMSIATVLVMMSGEVEYVDTLTSNNALNPNIRHAGITLTTYVFFIVIVVICLLNLLVGLAVSDVDTLHKESEAEMMSLKAGNVISGEYYFSLLPGRIRKSAACGCLKYQPNKITSCCSAGLTKMRVKKRIWAWFSVFEFNDYRLGATNLMKTLKKEQSTYDMLRRELSNFQNQLHANVFTPHVDSIGIERKSQSKRFVVPGARMLKRQNLQ
uniref:transient receptor potential cation channel subfamily A member 1-like isoform X1 n=1 Tax=Styela clava TaxID=7725 RepID=UPI00193AD3BA|nr:transient receptor potential cation channel subfamily A member 1-like isoform X1 [Styela clava]